MAHRPAATPKLLNEMARPCPSLLRSITLLPQSPTGPRDRLRGHARAPGRCSRRPRVRASAVGAGPARRVGAPFEAHSGNGGSRAGWRVRGAWADR
jgi:hypothetical protein